MRAYDAIKKTLSAGKRSGALKPGGQMPTYRELAKQLKCSYATVQSACRKLQEEGLLELRQGAGVYVSGSAPMTVKLYGSPATLPLDVYGELVKKHVRRRGLYLDVQLIDANELDMSSPQDCKPLDASCKAALVETHHNNRIAFAGKLNLQDFEGFEKLRAQLRNVPQSDISTSLPFFACTQLLAFNKRKLAAAGFPLKKLESANSLSWWDELRDACRKREIDIASSAWNDCHPWSVNALNRLIYALLMQESPDLARWTSGRRFDSAAGRKAFQIFSDHRLYQGHGRSPLSFECGTPAMSVSIGSWYPAQAAKTPFVPLKDVLFMPYRANGRKIDFIGLTSLQTFVSPKINPDERLRLWALLETLLSKEFQTEFCNLAGFLSVRSDIAPADYSWNSRPDIAEFIPQEGDIEIWSHQIDVTKTVALAALFMQWKRHGASLDQILKSLDEIHLDK